MTAVVTNIHSKVQEVVVCCAAIAWHPLQKIGNFSFSFEVFFGNPLGCCCCL
jgi:hypothetical protein